MSVPSLNVASNGVGVISDDQLNTFIQGGALVANLRAFTGVSNQMVVLLGGAAPSDGLQGSFYWNATSTATDDGGVTVVAPSGATVGRWLRSGPILGAANQTITGTLSVTGGTTIAGAASVGGALVAANGTSGSQVVNFSQFADVASANGSMFFPSGILLQWGSSVTTGSGGITLVWPTQFPTACWQAYPTIDFNAANGLIVSNGAKTQTTGTFITSSSITGAAVGSTAFSWWAIGN